MATHPEFTRDVFPTHLLRCFKYATLTKVQAHSVAYAFMGRGNMAVGAPTGSGKTLILESAFLQGFEQSSQVDRVKTLYIAPTRALLDERLSDWSSRFGSSVLGMQFACLFDDDLDHGFESADVLLATPEKWEAIMRNSNSYGSLVSSIKLLLIDEAHHIGDTLRGATLETVITRMMNIARESSLPTHLRIVATSAWFTNFSAFAKWIRCEEDGMFEFGAEFRPVPLRCVVKGCGQPTNDYLFERSLDHHIPEIIRQYAEGRPTLVFCNSRRSVERLARFISQSMHPPTSPQQILVSDMDHFLGSNPENDLGVSLPAGIGYHHAGMHASERVLVEEMFRQRQLSVLCCTSTLAIGVNLPARLVIVMGTKLYESERGYTDYSDTSIIQMIGRAGRIRFDTSGTAVILTDNNSVTHLRNLTRNATTEVVSHFDRDVTSVLNAEIVLKRVTSYSTALSWFRTTFYANNVDLVQSFNDVASQLLATSLDLLVESGMITRSGNKLTSTAEGSVMCRGCVKHSTMQSIMLIETSSITFPDLLRAIAQCDEVYRPVRRQDKAILNQLKGEARYQPTAGIKGWTEATKTSILIQARLSGASIVDKSLSHDADEILIAAQRIIRVILDFLLMKNHGSGVYSGLRLQRCLRLGSWADKDHIPSLLRLWGVEDSAASELESIGMTNIKVLAESDPGHINRCIPREPPIGELLVARARAVKEFQLNVMPASAAPSALRSLRLQVSTTKDKDSKNGTATLVVFSKKQLLHLREGIVESYDCCIPIPCALQGTVNVYLLHDTVCQYDVDTTIKVTDDTIEMSDTRETSSQGSILKSILRLEARHTRAKQQPISKFVVKTPNAEAQQSILANGGYHPAKTAVLKVSEEEPARIPSSPPRRKASPQVPTPTFPATRKRQRNTAQRDVPKTHKIKCPAQNPFNQFRFKPTKTSQGSPSPSRRRGIRLLLQPDSQKQSNQDRAVTVEGDECTRNLAPRIVSRCATPSTPRQVISSNFSPEAIRMDRFVEIERRDPTPPDHIDVHPDNENHHLCPQGAVVRDSFASIFF